MKYYLSAVPNGGAGHKAVKATKGTGSVLISFATSKDADRTIANIESLQPENVIIDSGAFSIWNSGKTIDAQALLPYYKKLQAYRSDIIFINLDVIPGSRGNKPTKEQARIACEQSWENYKFFKSNNIKNVLPVFHEDDDWTFLDMMMKDTEYIAISPANDSSTQRRMKWLDRCYAKLRADYKTHGLAATSVELLNRYPFYSVDSINWKTVHMFGNMKSKGLSQQHAAALARDNNALYHLFCREIQYYVDIQNKTTHLWEKRGVKWRD